MNFGCIFALLRRGCGPACPKAVFKQLNSAFVLITQILHIVGYYDYLVETFIHMLSSNCYILQ